MRLSTQDYHSTAEALRDEAQAGSNPAEQERLIATAKLARRMAELTKERRRARMNAAPSDSSSSAE